MESRRQEGVGKGGGPRGPAHRQGCICKPGTQVRLTGKPVTSEQRPGLLCRGVCVSPSRALKEAEQERVQKGRVTWRRTLRPTVLPVQWESAEGFEMRQ